MSNSNNNSTTGGVTFLGLLAITFIVLKLVGVIKWSWIWVLCPIWISPLIIIAILVFIIFISRR